ncbi:MAG: ArsR family transcriptional regulator [Anaerolineales bacterium]|nr:MAG: ArsR family transcriptional regulator [Anaerolineales bacterium]
MQDTRQQILEILKRLGEVTVQELSNELQLTSVTVRHHLEILRSEGYITEPQIRHSSRPGRPRYVYKLTSTAADLFPNNYSGLASALLDSIRECVSPDDQDIIMEKAAQYMTQNAGTLPVAIDDRLSSAVTFLNQHGYTSRWGKDDNNDYVIYVSSCPYHHVSQEHDQTCQVDAHIINLLTGGGATRILTGAKDGGLCVYKVRWSL